MTLSEFVLIGSYTMGLRWLVFRYSKLSWLQDWLKNNSNGLLQELGSCVYCQTVEAAVVVNLLLQNYDVRHIVLSSLAIGLLGMLANNWLESLLVDRTAVESEKTIESAHLSPDPERFWWAFDKSKQTWVKIANPFEQQELGQQSDQQ